MQPIFKRACLCSLVLFVAGLGVSGSPAQVKSPTAPDGYVTYLPLIALRRPPEWIGPDGGLIASIAIYPPDPAIVYAGSWGGGVYKSMDGGGTWTWKSQGVENLTVVSLAVDPADPAVVYAGTYKGKVFKTIDGGETWFFSSQGIQDQAIVYSIVIDPQNVRRIYIATRGASNNGNQPWNGVVYRSDDYGASWTRKLYNLGGTSYQDYVYALTINPNFPNVLFAATHEHGIYKSTNYGDTWHSANNGITNFSTRAVVTGPNSEYADYVYTGVWERRGVYKSTDQGASWSQKDNGISGSHIYGMDIDPNRPRSLYLATYGMGVMKTTDAANDWFASGLQADPIATVHINPADSQVVFAGTAGDGLYASHDSGGSWAHSQAGLKASSATSLVVSPDDPSVLYVGIDGSGVRRSQDRGASWSDFSHGLGSPLINVLVEQPGRRILFALTDGAGLYRCDLLNVDSCWQRVGSNLPSIEGQGFLGQPGRPFASRGTFLEAFGEVESGIESPSAVPGNSGLLAISFALSNPDVAYLGAAGSGVYKTADGGVTWAAAGLSGYNVWSLAIDPVDPQIVYAAETSAGSVKTSVDGGSHWSSLSLPGVTIYSMAVSPARELYAGTDNGVYRLSGGAWQQTGLAGSAVAWLTFHPAHANLLFAGTTDGAFQSADSGGSWSPGPAELLGHTVQSISIDPFDPDLIYYCTTAHGVLRAGMGN